MLPLSRNQDRRSRIYCDKSPELFSAVSTSCSTLSNQPQAHCWLFQGTILITIRLQSPAPAIHLLQHLSGLLHILQHQLLRLQQRHHSLKRKLSLLIKSIHIHFLDPESLHLASLNILPNSHSRAQHAHGRTTCIYLRVIGSIGVVFSPRQIFSP